MPIYEYKCLNCTEVFEVEHSAYGKYNKLDCPYCTEYSKVEKLISLCSFKLSWSVTPHPGTRTPVKRIGNQLYDEQSYNKAKEKGHFRTKRIRP